MPTKPIANPLSPDQRELAADPAHLALARRVAARCTRGRLRHLADDAEAAALAGLVEAAGRWDPGRGVPFGAYARPRDVARLRREMYPGIDFRDRKRVATLGRNTP